VPLDALHLTLGRVGFTDAVSTVAVHDAVDRAAQNCRELKAFELAVGPTAGSAGAIRFSVAPWPPLLELHQYLSRATRSALGEQCAMDTSSFRPHLSVAYSNKALPISAYYPLFSRYGPWRRQRPSPHQFNW
jgi:2'-5' RNA ligase